MDPRRTTERNLFKFRLAANNMEMSKIQRPGSLANQSHHQGAFSSSSRSRHQGNRHSVSGSMPSPISPVNPQHAYQQSPHGLQLSFQGQRLAGVGGHIGGGGSSGSGVSMPSWGYQQHVGQKKRNGSGQVTPDGRKVMWAISSIRIM